MTATLAETVVRVAEAVVARRNETLASLGLGSCVAIVLHDAAAGVGGMAHVLLPEPFANSPVEKPAKFAKSAVPHLVQQLCAAGARVERLEARLAGGASMFPALMTGQARNMGERNVEATREALARLGIPVRAEDVGGDFGRSVRFDPASGAVTVSTVGRGERDL